jgi:hypothetical protein
MALIFDDEFEDPWQEVEKQGGDTALDADWLSMTAAKRTVSAWTALPRQRREDPRDLGAQALFDAGFALLTTEQAKRELAQHGAEESLERDDARALAGFLTLGAHFPALEIISGEAHDDYKAYGDAWEGSIASLCAKRGLTRCLRLFLENGTLARDAAVADPLLKEPQASPLRQVDRAFLAKASSKKASEAGDLQDSGDDLILALVGAMANDSESLSSSIALSEARRCHPLFRLLAGEIEKTKFDAPSKKQKATASPLTPLAQDMAKAGFFKPELASHRGAALSLAADGSEPACQLLADAGLDVSCASRHIAGAFEKLLCNPQGLMGLSQGQQKICEAWAAKDGFGQELFERALNRARKAVEAHVEDPSQKGAFDQWRAVRRVGRVQALALAQQHDDRGFEAVSFDVLAAAQTWIDHALLDDSVPKGSKELRSALEKAGAAIASMRLPKRPAPRV